MSKFKVGDKVKRINSTHAGMCVGDTSEITKVRGISVELKNYSGAHDPENLKLIKRGNTMTKSDLKTGMILEDSDGEKAMVLLGTKNGDIAVGETWYNLNWFNEDLTNSTCSIVKIHQPGTNMGYKTWNGADLIWEREEEKLELTIEQIARKFGKDVTEIRIKD